MLWPTLFAVAVATLVVVHFFWRHHHRRLAARHETARHDFDALRREHELLATRKEAEQQALFNSMTEGVLVLDRTGRIQLVNQSLQRMFDLPPDVRGQTVLEA